MIDDAALLERDVAETVGVPWVHVVGRHRSADDVQQEFHDTFVDTTWPHCPEHASHPLWLEDGVWKCQTSGREVAKLGELGAVWFADAIEGWRRGDFDRLRPLFEPRPRPLVIDWHRRRRFDGHAPALAEAFSNACFLGITPVVEYLLNAGVDPLAGNGTGLDGLHWAVNRGKLQTTKLLIARGLPLETRNSHGQTVLGTAVWSIINEPWWPDHLAIVDVLVRAGAKVDPEWLPTGRDDVDAILRRAL